MHWHLFIEEYHPMFHYIKGDHNTFADALSHLPQKEEKSVRVKPFLAPNTPTNRDQHANVVNDNQLDDDNAFTFSTIMDEKS
jgi:hypothetical protein